MWDVKNINHFIQENDIARNVFKKNTLTLMRMDYS